MLTSPLRIIDTVRARRYLALARRQSRSGQCNVNLKEIIMNETPRSELELNIVELGNAKEKTMGIPGAQNEEDHPLVPWQYPTA